MLISAITSLIISMLVLDSGIIPGVFSNFLESEVSIVEQSMPVEKNKGAVLGAKEKNDNLINTPKEISETIIKVMENVKNKSLSKISDIYLNNEAPEEEEFSGPKRIPEAIEYEITARSGIVVDYDSGQVLFKKNIDKVMPIASITKLMTALVWLEYNPGWETIYEIKREDRRNGGKIYLYLGEKVAVKDLFYLSLVGSANTATIALINSTGISEQEFVDKMNNKAKELGLTKTTFSDPVGLNNNNVSTAEEISHLARKALSFKDIRQATLTKEYEFTTQSGKNKVVYTTDNLLENFPQNGLKIIGGKTGYTEAAGYCFVGEFINKDGLSILSVILGSESSEQRFNETRNLVEWVHESYQWDY
ncbi:MAG: D-alanyl-D-alanine carboxypeptidase family protein [Patescibacteria group bacterium]